MNIYARVIRGVKWHALEAISYQFLLSGHRLLLFQVLGATAFGALGCIFGSVYGLIFLANIGFNDSLIAFFKELSASRETSTRFFRQQAIPHLCLLLALPLGLWFLPFHAISTLPTTIYLTASALFICESIRITLRMLLQLTFINKELAFIDVGGLCLYIACVWSLWFFGVALTQLVILLPLAVISCVQVLLLIRHLWHWHKCLPSNTCKKLPPYKRIMRVRLFAYAHHMLSSHFVSNFIIPYAGFVWGLEYASLAKLLSSASQLITTILKHTIGFSSAALFSHFKHAPSAEKNSAFKLINRFLFATLFISITLCGIVYKILGPYMADMHINTALIVLLLLVLTFENCFITCEAAYLSEERPEAMAVMYALGIGALYAMFNYQTTHHVLLLSTSFLTIRLLSLSILTFMLTQRWKSSN